MRDFLWYIKIMDTQTFIFVGRSGAGKGTQLELLKKFVSNKTPNVDSCSVDMGNIFRKFMKADGFAQEQIKETMQKGNLVPDFMTCTLYTKELLENLNADNHLYIDGIPRSNAQADAVAQSISFFNRKNVVIIDISISSEEAKKRMLLRNRSDDTEDAVMSRFSFYENSVIPAVEYMKNNSGFKYIQVNGEGSVEEIHTNIINALNF